MRGAFGQKEEDLLSDPQGRTSHGREPRCRTGSSRVQTVASPRPGTENDLELLNPSELYLLRLLSERHHGTKVISRIQEIVQRKYLAHSSLPVQLMQLI